MPRFLPSLAAFFFLSLVTTYAQVASGPMLAQVEMREATIWVQTDAPAEVRIKYQISDAANNPYWSQSVQTRSDLANCAQLTLDQIEAGTSYNYRVEVAGVLTSRGGSFTSPSFFKDLSPPPDLRIAVGGAHYVNQEGFDPPYQTLGAGYEVFSSIAAQSPDLMLWVGNTAHLRDSDWRSQSGYMKRFSHTRACPEMSALIASTPNYATWGDRDYSATHAGHYYSYRQESEISFRTFWPMPTQVRTVDGIATRFSRSDVDFFMLDVRSNRNDTPDAQALPQILGKAQIEWLRQELLLSTATFKVIVAGAPILNPADNKENLSSADREHTDLLQMLRNEKISGLFFISGGKYYGELTRLVHANSYNLYDLSVGPLTAKPRENNNQELNFFRMPGSSSFERQFALIDFTGPEEDRQIEMRVMNTFGTELWSRTVKASQLKAVGGR
ncbi:MAG: alkaline phosphatase D [Lentimonas sp.]|jgi:alkaline phosphatase D